MTTSLSMTALPVQATIVVAPNVASFLVGMNGARLKWFLHNLRDHSNITANINLFNQRDFIRSYSDARSGKTVACTQSLFSGFKETSNEHNTEEGEEDVVLQDRQLNIQTTSMPALLTVLRQLTALLQRPENARECPPLFQYYPATLQYVMDDTERCTQFCDNMPRIRTEFPRVWFDLGHTELVASKMKAGQRRLPPQQHQQLQRSHSKPSRAVGLLLLYVRRMPACTGREWRAVNVLLRDHFHARVYQPPVERTGVLPGVSFQFLATTELLHDAPTALDVCRRFTQTRDASLMPVLQIGGAPDRECNNVSFSICCADPAVSLKQQEEWKEYVALSTRVDECVCSTAGDSMAISPASPFRTQHEETSSFVTGLTFVTYSSAAQQVWYNDTFQRKLAVIVHHLFVDRVMVQLHPPLYPETDNIITLCQCISVTGDDMNVVLDAFGRVYTLFGDMAANVLKMHPYDFILYKNHHNCAFGGSR